LRWERKRVGLVRAREKIVILSAAGTSRSEVSAKSKDPYALSRPQARQGILPALSAHDQELAMQFMVCVPIPLLMILFRQYCA
jgi:hypothetical protein